MVGIGHGGQFGNQLVIQKLDRRGVSSSRGRNLSRRHAGSCLTPKCGRQLHPVRGLLVVLLIAAPWHILATLRNPPYFDLTLRSAPGEYHGFLWFYFINEQLLRFLNMRYPRDYDTVPRLYFWLFHLLWLFPWSVYFPAVAKLSFKPYGTCGKDTVAGPVLGRFYPGVFHFFHHAGVLFDAVLSGARAAPGIGDGVGGRLDPIRYRFLCGIFVVAAAAVLTLYFLVVECSDARRYFRGAQLKSGRIQAFAWAYGRPHDRFLRLSSNPAPRGRDCVSYRSGRYFSSRGRRAFLATVLMAVLFFQAARIAMAAFDHYLSSRPLAETLRRAPAGKLIVDHHYYTFSSIFFYTNRDALLLNGRFNNLVYGSYAPGAPNVFIDDAQWKALWLQPDRCYLVITQKALERLKKLVEPKLFTIVAQSGGKLLLTNHPVGRVA